MQRFVLAVGAVMALVLATPARANVAAYWHGVTQDALEFERSGTPVGWENGYGRGETIPRPAFTNGAGYTCREFEAVLLDSGQRFIDAACRGGDGAWFLQRGQVRPAYDPPPRVVYRPAPAYVAPPVAYYPYGGPYYRPYYKPYHYGYPRPYPSSGFTFVYRSGGRDHDRHYRDGRRRHYR